MCGEVECRHRLLRGVGAVLAGAHFPGLEPDAMRVGLGAGQTERTATEALGRVELCAGFVGETEMSHVDL